MPRGHPDLPRASAHSIQKADVFRALQTIDRDEGSRGRILRLEDSFRSRIAAHAAAMPTNSAKLGAFNTSPYVLMMFAQKHGLTKLSQIESSILPAKEFSSMETSAGKMVELIVLPEYGWDVESVESGMHSEYSALDGKRMEDGTLKVVTLKSGPKCLNDEMSENFADAILSNVAGWARNDGCTRVEFTYGVLYGTKKQSNKKDWHILRNLMEKHPKDYFQTLPKSRWDCDFTIDGIQVNVAVRIGQDWWSYLGGDRCMLELGISLVRACVAPGEIDPLRHSYTISDLADISSLPSDPPNLSIIQRPQLPWLMLFLRHFCDHLD